MSTNNPISITTGAGLTGGPIAGAGVITVAPLINAQTGTSYAIQTTDNCKLITFNNIASVAVTIVQATTTGFGVGFNCLIWNYGPGTVTITPSTSTINNGATSITIPKDTGIGIVSDGANYQVVGATALTPATNTPSPVLRGYIGRLIMSNDGTLPNTVIDISTGMCTDSTATKLMILGTAITKSISGTFVAGSGNNGLDTGAVASSTWYHVYIISNATATLIDVLFSLSATAPTMPSGYTLFRRIGSIKTDGSSHILGFTQIGNTFYWKTQINDVAAVTPSTSGTLYTLSTPLGVSTRALCRFMIVTNIGTQTGYFIQPVSFSLGSVSIAITTTPLASFVNNASANENLGTPIMLHTTTSSQLFIVASSTTSTIAIDTRGYIDDRGTFS